MLKLLVVDDEFVVRLGLKSIVDWEAHGITIVGEAANGKEALDMYHALAPDIVLTDIKMPIMNGLDFLKTLREEDPYVCVVILSCYNDFEYVREAMQCGAIDYITKPTMNSDDVVQLITRIKKHILKNPHFEGQHSSGPAVPEKPGRDFFPMLLSPSANADDAVKILKELGLDIPAEKIGIIAMRPDNPHLVPSLNGRQNAALIYSTILNIISEAPDNGQKSVSIHDGDKSFLLLYRHNSKVSLREMHSEIYSYCMYIRDTVIKYLNISVSFGIGAICAGASDLPFAFTEAFNTLETRFFKGSGSICFKEDQAKSVQADGAIAEKFPFRYSFLKSAVAGNIEEVKTLFRDIKQKLCQSSSVRRAKQLLLEMALYILKELSSAAGLSEPDSSSIYESIKKCDTFDAVCDYICEKIQEITGSGTYDTECNKIVNSVKLYIRQHYNEDLKLDKITSHFNISKNYFCQLFKKITGQTYVSYLTVVRIEKAKELLIKTNLKIYNIASEVGIPNPRHFSRLFKKYAGVLPMDYRNFNSSSKGNSKL